MFKDEKNDNACCCIGPSYIGVLIFGALTAVFWCYNFYLLIELLLSDKPDNDDFNYAMFTVIFNLIVNGIALIPYILCLIWQKNAAVRLSLLIITVGVLIINVTMNIIFIVKIS